MTVLIIRQMRKLGRKSWRLDPNPMLVGGPRDLETHVPRLLAQLAAYLMRSLPAYGTRAASCPLLSVPQARTPSLCEQLTQRSRARSRNQKKRANERKGEAAAAPAAFASHSCARFCAELP